MPWHKDGPRSDLGPPFSLPATGLGLVQRARNGGVPQSQQMKRRALHQVKIRVKCCDFDATDDMNQFHCVIARRNVTGTSRPMGH